MLSVCLCQTSFGRTNCKYLRSERMSNYNCYHAYCVSTNDVYIGNPINSEMSLIILVTYNSESYCYDILKDNSILDI